MRVRITKTISPALCAAAFAVSIDPYYSGVVDIVTGEAVADGESASRVFISGSMYYDEMAHSFVYPRRVVLFAYCKM